MTNEETKDLCLRLLRADTEQDVVSILKSAGYWDDPAVWRLYGDREGNYATIGAQQSRPEAALVEKIVNSVDARLMNECQCRGIDPKSAAAPNSIRQAVARFVEDRDIEGEIGGKVQRWARDTIREQSQYITLAATGTNKHTCLTIADRGEGQTPDKFPETFLSIDRSNKLRIRFVQGKFNMGGTGALRFCGDHKLQLLISKRNPTIVSEMGESDSSSEYWGFTVVRREQPKAEIGAVRNSMYTYLAPKGSDRNPQRGFVLRFPADTLPLMPRLNQAYVQEVDWGTAMKLYNFNMKGFTSHILMKDGLLYRLDMLLPEIGLPISMHECRSYRGKPGASFVTPLSGLATRLEEGRGNNLEENYPTSVPFSVNGERMTAKIYAFKKGKAETYRTNEGIIFTVNGQTHGNIPKTIFQRKRVGMGRLDDSLLVVVDCSEISVTAREDLFMNTRDRLSSNDIRKDIESQLEDILHNHPGLRALREQRRSEEIAERLSDSKPLEDVLASILKTSPSLASLLLTGTRLSNPHRKVKVKDGEGHGPGNDKGNGPFSGTAHPTYFRFNKKKDGEELIRDCELGRKCRLTFQTDVENEYFSRTELPGRYDLEIQAGSVEKSQVNHSLTLHDGFAHWSIELPDDLVVGDKVSVRCSVSDEAIGDPFVNVAHLTLRPASNPGKGNGKPKSQSGKGADQGENERRSGFQMPTIIKVHEAEYEKYQFDKHTACTIVADTVEVEGEDSSAWEFRVNVDNVYLRTDMKQTRIDPKLAEAKFVYGNVLIGLALIHDDAAREKANAAANGSRDEEGRDQPTIQAIVKQTTHAIAPFILPMIDSLGSLTEEQIASLAEAGDEE